MAADKRYFRNGVGGWPYRGLDVSHAGLVALKAAGHDHVRIMFAPEDNLTWLQLWTYRALALGLRVVWTPNFYWDWAAKPWDSNRLFEDVSHADSFWEMYGQAAAEFPHTRLAIELVNELGWYKRRTEDRAVANGKLLELWQRAVPRLRKYTPKHTIILPTAGTGKAFWSENDFEGLPPVPDFMQNVWMSVHDYHPHALTHFNPASAGDEIVSAPVFTDWPDPHAFDKMTELQRWQNSRQPGSEGYAFNRDGLAIMLEPLAAWQRDNRPVYIGEWGMVYQRGTATARAYEADKRAAFAAYGFMNCRWVS